MRQRYTRPVPITVDYRLDDFDCDDPVLNEWLTRRAIDNESRGSSRTYIACVEGRVVGYYCLAAAAVPRANATGRARRQMPDPIPAFLLGRLAVDRQEQGTGLGRHLVRDALLRCLAAADVIGARMLIAHASNDAARAFYEHLGLEPSPTDPMHLMVTLADARRSVPR